MAKENCNEAHSPSEIAHYESGIAYERDRIIHWLRDEAAEGGASSDEKAVMVAGIMAAIAADIERVG